jgi:hypothetical protein
MQLGDLEGALADLDLAVAAAPEWALPYVHRGQVRLILGQEVGALADLDVAILALRSATATEQTILPALLSTRSRLHHALGHVAQAEADRVEAAEVDASIRASGA